MAVDYGRLPTQYGALLRMLRKRHALQDHLRLAMAQLSNSDKDLLTVALGFRDTETDEGKVLSTLTTHLDGAALTSIRSAYTALQTIIEGDPGFFRFLGDDLAVEESDRSVGAIE